MEDGHDAPRSTGAHTAGTRGRALFWLFPIAVTLLGFFSLGGNWGLYMDDYNTSIHDPRTGELDWSMNAFRERPYFWRPLLLLQWKYVQSPLWDALWLHHLLQGLTHAGAALLTYLLLRELRLRRLAAIGGAGLFMFWPLNHEPAFWASAITIPQAHAMFLGVTLLVIRFARGRASIWLLPLFTPLAFVIPCLYEQPGMLILCFPLLLLTPALTFDRRTAARLIAATFFCGMAMVVYVGLLSATAPGNWRGASSSYISLGELDDRLRSLTDSFRFIHFWMLPAAVRGGLELAWSTLGEVRGVCVLGVASGLGGMWVLRSARPDERIEESNRRWAKMAGVVLLGLAMWVLSYAPLVPIRNQMIETRSTYVAALGLAVVLGILIECWVAIGSRLRVAPWWNGITAGVMALAMLLGSLWMHGLQRLFQLRTRADAAQIQTLRLGFANVPPRTVFVTFEERYEVLPDHALFNRLFSSWTLAEWAAPATLHHAFRRDDIYATTYNPWLFPAYSPREMDADGFVYPLGVVGLHNPGDRVQWTRTVPFRVGETGDVEVLERLFIERPNGDDLEIEPPLAQSTPALPRGTIALRTPAAPDGATALTGWLSGASQLSEFDAYAFGELFPRRSIRMFPHGMMGLPEEARLRITAAPLPRRVLLRATLEPLDLARCRSCGPSEVVVTVRDETGELSRSRVELDPGIIAANQRWLPLVVAIPPGVDVELTARVEATAPGPGLYPSVLLSTGWIFPETGEPAVSKEG